MAAGTVPVSRRAASRPPFWRDERIRSIVLQIVTLALVIGFFAYIAHNTAQNLRARGIASGFGFLGSTSGFDVSFSLIPYSAVNTYARALLVGFLNTLLVAVLGIVCATILGFVIGLARLSKNWLVAKLATVYVEVIRNIPLLLQLIFWYTSVFLALPASRNSISLGDAIFLSNGGLNLPRPIPGDGFGLVLAAFALAVAGAFVLAHWARRRQEATGQPFPVSRTAVALIIGLPLLAFLALGMPLTLEFPEQGRFRLTGGLHLLPELVALVLGLSIYTASFIAEIVRAGILSVGRGQTEAANALGLRPGQVSRLVVLPQALRVIVPPLTSQYLNLTKNSSLAIAIAYPDLVYTGGTTLNQTGQAIEVVTIWMVVYVSLSLVTSFFMNWYNRRIALVER